MAIKRPDKNTTPLRQEAEAQLAQAPPIDALTRPAGELLHELQVHQIELEMQNEQLRQAQIALEESRDRYANLYEFAPVGYLTLTDKGIISEINITGTTLLKTERNKLLQHRFSPFIAPEDRDRWDCHFLNVLTRDDTLTCELALQHGDGPRIYARLDCLCLKKNGKESVVRVALTDITKRKQAEDKLAESARHFRAVTESANDVIITGTSDGNIVDWNAAAGRLFGYTETEIIGQPLTVLMPERFHNLHSVGLARVMAGGTTHLIGRTVEFFGLRKDGSEFPLELSLAQWQTANDKFFTAIIRDITERKRAENSLRQLSLAVEQSPNSIIITDLDANIEYANAAFVKTTGYSLAEVIGQNPRLLHSGKTPKATYVDLWAHLTRGEAWKGEFINRRKNGSEYIESVLFSPVRQADGSVTNYLAIKEDITEHRQMEDALRASEANLRALVEHSPIAMIVDAGVDADEKIMMMNQQFTGLFGYTMDDVPDVRHWWQLAYPDKKYREELMTEWIGKVEKATQSHGDIEPMETTVTCKDGSSRYVRISLASTGGRNIVTFEDLTEIKHAEKDLRLFKELLEKSNDAIFINDAETSLILDVNEQALKNLGYTREEFLGMRVTDIEATLPEKFSWEKHMMELDAAGFMLLEGQHRGKDGVIFPVEISTRNIQVKEGKFNLAIVRDITERKKAQASEVRYRRLFESAKDGILILDAETCMVVDANPFMVELLGYSHENYLGKHIWDIGFLKNVAANKDKFMELQQQDYVRYEDLSLETAHGQTIHVEFVSNVYLVGNTRVVQYNIRDITERKLAEAAVLQLNAELENKIIARTADLDKARHDAEQANQAKSAFLASMSHEIRTPMNGVIGMIDVLQQSSLNGSQMETTNIIHDSAFALLTIIDDILDFSKIEAGKLQIDYAPMNVAGVVEGTCETLIPLALKKGVELTLFTDPNIPAAVMGDPGRLRQILVNLANNAIKFSSGQDRQGKASVRAVLVEDDSQLTVSSDPSAALRTKGVVEGLGGSTGSPRTGKGDLEQVTLEFRVTDNGIGMDETTQARLFTPFIQADTSTTRSFDGTGLGLVIARQLANIMSGEITLHSELGKGSMFSVRLPFALLPGVGRDKILEPTQFLPPHRGKARMAAMTRRCEAFGAGMAASHPLPQSAGFASNVSRDVGVKRVEQRNSQASTPSLALPLQGGGNIVAELSCLVVGSAESLANDLAVYLEHDGAVVEQAADIAAAQQWISNRPPGLCIVVIDAEGVNSSLDGLRAAARTQQNVDVRFVVIGRGGRRQCRVVATDHVALDAEVMHRRAFLEAVAIAAGRAKPPDRESLPGDVKTILRPLSREEARRQGSLILIAEDNEINQKVLLQQLRLLGRTADIANDGREALERWQSGDYALLFTDLHMPEMDGYELTTAIRAAETKANEHTRIPIIAITANALKGEADHCRAIGMDDYLSKPVQLVNLKAMLEKWMPVVSSDLVADEATSTGVLPYAPTCARMVGAYGDTPLVAEKPSPSSVPVDVNVLKALVGDDEAMIREFLHDFRVSAAKIAAELRAACAAGEAAAAGALAHKLKSSARSVGALTLGELCAAMEKAGKAGDTTELALLLPGFEQELAGVEGYLEGY